ncbi:tyrosine-type recombinase/integrase [Bradyrhizobium liaoningense]|uniref:tyrosine-type recombinase/integrase n=1 Tax=Bradyrhizobium liaoningense TaxID=43992 RepID=UPI001BA79BA6|nr:tyrosine-type recombinase/integrase [Bradyrhizobium liaoningense]MBR1170501.1 tyrosine-type recombinase/integrase [Bradyrhizobium liaoningense]
MPERLGRRDGIWIYVRRRPESVPAEIEPRINIRISTGIRISDDKSGVKAARAARKIEIDLEASWAAKAGQGAREAVLALEDARARAQALELPYKPIEDVVKESIDDIHRRLAALEVGERRHDPKTVAAAVGGVPLPEIMLSGLVDEFEVAKKTTLARFSKGQRRKWRNGKVRAIARLTDIIGDKAIDRITRDDALHFMDHWAERVVDGQVVAETANRNLTHITGMLSAVARRHRLRLEPVFAGLRLEGEGSRPRPPFSAWWIVNRLLAPGALDAMNEEERAAFLVLINTGARPSEIINLRAPHIHLESNIPHIQVRPDERVLKTEFSWRDIPLVGISLEAMRQFPDGFPRYRDNGDAFSAAVNKYLEDHGLRETERHTAYSLRHGFKDRLRETEATDELKDELMGHDSKKPKYGDGHGLHLKLKIIEKIALASGMVVAAPLQLVKVRA